MTKTSWSDLRAEINEAFGSKPDAAEFDVDRIAATAMVSHAKVGSRLSTMVATAVAVAVPCALIFAVAGPAMLGHGPAIHHPIVAATQTVGPTGKVIKVELALGPGIDVNASIGDTVAVHLHKDGALNSPWGGPSYASGQGLGNGPILAPETSYPGTPTPNDRDRYFAFQMVAEGEVWIGFQFPTSCTGAQPCPAPAALLRLHIGIGVESSPTPLPGPTVTAMQLISPQWAWMITDRLHVTTDGGRSWLDPHPPEQPTTGFWMFAPGDEWVAVAVMATTTGQSHIRLYHTQGLGAHWSSTSFTDPRSAGAGYSVDFLQFSPQQATRNRGWMMVDYGSHAGFNYTDLLRTDDAGRTWKRLSLPPTQDPADLQFFDANRGTAVGTDRGTGAADAYLTFDGGATWGAVALEPPTGYSGQHLYPLRPVLIKDLAGVMPMGLGPDQDHISSLAFYDTSDGGRTWTSSRVVSLRASAQLLNLIPDTTYDDRLVIVAEGSGQAPYAVSPDGVFATQGLPVGTGQLSMGDTLNGWALVRSGGCRSFKSDCFQSATVYATADGGHTWTPLKAP